MGAKHTCARFDMQYGYRVKLVMKLFCEATTSCQDSLKPVITKIKSYLDLNFEEIDWKCV